MQLPIQNLRENSLQEGERNGGYELSHEVLLFLERAREEIINDDQIIYYGMNKAYHEYSNKIKADKCKHHFVHFHLN